MRIAALTAVASFVVILVGSSRPQNNAIAAAIEDETQLHHDRAGKREGTADGGWILIDYGDILVNVMSERARDYYDLEVTVP